MLRNFLLKRSEMFKRLKNIFALTFNFIILESLKMSYSYFSRKISKITVVRAINVKTSRSSAIPRKLNYLESEFFSGFAWITFEQLNGLAFSLFQ